MSWWFWHAVGVLVVIVTSLVFGVTTATTRGAIGPHEARFDVTTDSTMTLDVGPLGTLQVDSPMPLTLGVRAVVQEIPQDATGVGQAETLIALQEDLDQYVGLFTGLSTEIRSVAVALVIDAAWRTVGALVVLVATWVVLRRMLGPQRREELVVGLRPRARVLVASTMIVLLGATVLTSSLAPRDRPNLSGTEASPVFEGTALEGARITGRLGGIIDTYSAMVITTIRQNDEFYDGAQEALEIAWSGYEARSELAARTQVPETGQTEPQVPDQPDVLDEPGTSPQTQTPAQVGTPAQPAAPAQPEQAASPRPGSATASPTAKPVTVVLVSDLHCNVGMARVISTLVRLSDARVVIDAGDTTINGTSVEEQCVQTFARAIPDRVRLVAVAGNHDSRTTTRAYARAGATVLSGSVVSVGGIRFFGDADPNQTLFGQSASTRDETEAQAGARIADQACRARGVDVLLVHNPRVATPSLERGCAPVSLSGHMHTRTDPIQVGSGIRYISASSGGAVAGEVTLGPLSGTAEMTVLQWDPTTRAFITWQVVQIHPDGSATVEDPQPWPPIDPSGLQTPAPEPTGGY
ncbi:MAG: metallophosphoesterase family protein [Micrococcales bacterium]|nr:metallophosphoesterase family protein [Micrococcales bacterium]